MDKTMSEHAQILRRAAELLSEPDRWCRELLAKDAGGNGVPSTSPEARSWCMLGATIRSSAGYHDKALGGAVEALGSAVVDLGFSDDRNFVVEQFNDAEDTSHEDVMLVFKHAIDDAD